ncbi:MAG: RNA polymerase sigma factor, partial [Lachnospiraceae bacterium]|nr:RNA polymerase sigma factor [Lachnospiraceae bacterium]
MCYVISSESRKEAGKINSRENFIRLVNQYQNLVFSICLKHTGDYFVAEDLAQETFLSAYAHMEDFDGEAEKAWICRIASNKSIDYLRQAARKSIPTAEEDMPEEATA